MVPADLDGMLLCYCQKFSLFHFSEVIIYNRGLTPLSFKWKNGNSQSFSETLSRMVILSQGSLCPRGHFGSLLEVHWPPSRRQGEMTGIQKAETRGSAVNASYHPNYLVIDASCVEMPRSWWPERVKSFDLIPQKHAWVSKSFKVLTILMGRALRWLRLRKKNKRERKKKYP